MLLTGSGVVVEVEARFGELEGERPDGFVAVNVVGAAEDAPDVGELEAGELELDEVFGFFVTEESVGGGVVATDAIERKKRRGETMIGLNDNSLLVGAESGEFFGGVFDDREVTPSVSDEEVFGNGARNALEGVEGLASSATMLRDVTDEM